MDQSLVIPSGQSGTLQRPQPMQSQSGLTSPMLGSGPQAPVAWHPRHVPDYASHQMQGMSLGSSVPMQLSEAMARAPDGTLGWASVLDERELQPLQHDSMPHSGYAMNQGPFYARHRPVEMWGAAMPGYEESMTTWPPYLRELGVRESLQYADWNDMQRATPATVLSNRMSHTLTESRDGRYEVYESIEYAPLVNAPTPAARRRQARQWACPVPGCERAYRFKGDLKYHVQKKHSELAELPDQISRPRSAKAGKPFPCPVGTCKCGFKWQRDLRRHLKLKHAEYPADSEETTEHRSSMSEPVDMDADMKAEASS